jgi:hypothetical protein
MFFYSNDLWSSDLTSSPQMRSGLIGYSFLSAICTAYSVSIIEDHAFNSIGVIRITNLSLKWV